MPICVPGEFGCLRDAASATIGWIKVLQNWKKKKKFYLIGFASGFFLRGVQGRFSCRVLLMMMEW
jgi:hypothetical protein